MARKLFLVLGASLLGLVFWLVVPGRHPSSELRPDDIKAYVQFVERHTTYRIQPLPQIKILGTQEFSIEAARGGQTTIPYSLYRAGVVILDGSKFNLKDDESRSSLVHLLVHHAQEHAIEGSGGAEALDRQIYQRTGMDKRCKKPRTWEAFSIQDQWLKENGSGLRLAAAVMNQKSACELG